MHWTLLLQSKVVRILVLQGHMHTKHSQGVRLCHVDSLDKETRNHGRCLLLHAYVEQ
jgi:hypothetical protein